MSKLISLSFPNTEVLMHESASLLPLHLYCPSFCLLLISHNSQSKHRGAYKILSIALTSTPSPLDLCICQGFFSICANKFLAGGFFYSAITWEHLLLIPYEEHPMTIPYPLHSQPGNFFPNKNLFWYNCVSFLMVRGTFVCLHPFLARTCSQNLD